MSGETQESGNFYKSFGIVSVHREGEKYTLGAGVYGVSNNLNSSEFRKAAHDFIAERRTKMAKDAVELTAFENWLSAHP